MLSTNTDHPYQTVRQQVAKLLAEVLTFNLTYHTTQHGDQVESKKWNVGDGFPSPKDFIQSMLPQLTNSFQAIATCNQTKQDQTQLANMLETLALFLWRYIQATPACIPIEFYQLLPFLCQFIGIEVHEGLSHTCLNALCFLSICCVSRGSIPHVLDTVENVSQSTSWKARLSIPEFLQIFVQTNFMSMCLKQDLVARCEKIVVDRLCDDNVNVKSKAAKVLCGMIHSKFIEHQTLLLSKFREKICLHDETNNDTRTRSFPPEAKKRRKDKQKFQTLYDHKDFFKMLTKDKKMLCAYHSGILGLCSLVEAYPHDVPSFMPEVLMELQRHLHDPQPVPKTIKRTLQEFKRTHQDNWEEHKLKFTEDQLMALTDLLVSQNYYA